MKKLIIIFGMILFFNFVFAQTEPEIYYKLNLNYDQGKLNISSIEIEFSQEKIENYFGFYTVNILDYDDEILETVFFKVPNKFIWDGIDPETGEISFGGEGELDEVSFEIFVSYYENAKEIIIYDENLNEVTKISVGEYSRERGKEREVLEKEQIKQGFEDKSSKEITLTERLAGYWWIFLIGFVILIIVLFNSLKKKKKV